MADQGRLAHHFFTMAANNAWANLRLYRSCEKLSTSELEAPRVSFFGSILATANHQLTADWFYIDALQRAQAQQEPHPHPGDFFEPEYPFEQWSELFSAQKEADRQLLSLCQKLDEKTLDWPVRIIRRKGETKDPTHRVLSHLFQHQIHHRGQIHGLLSCTDQAPPQLDEFFSVGEAHLRKEELAELGLSEEILWQD